jgi:AraC-like DNA-binding protein
VSGLATVADPDVIVRLAERSREEATRFLLSTLVPREAKSTDWVDELALDLIANPSLSLSRWSQRMGLTPWAVSRGFMQVFGLSPKSFRARARARAVNSCSYRRRPHEGCASYRKLTYGCLHDLVRVRTRKCPERLQRQTPTFT